MIDRINLSEENTRLSIHIVHQVQLLLIELEQIKENFSLLCVCLSSNIIMIESTCYHSIRTKEKNLSPTCTHLTYR